MHSAQIVMIGQLEDVGFVFFQIDRLWRRADNRLRWGMEECFSGSLFNYSMKTYKSLLFDNNDYANIIVLHLTFLIV
jgi:hypothetical protein